MNIALYGFMGAGKTSLGKALATKLNYLFVDLDAEIVKVTQQNINDIFNEKGEIAFRKIEHEVLKEFIKKNDTNVVLSLGGGTIIQPSNRKLLELRAYKPVFIDVNINTLIKRLKNDKNNRPLLRNIANNEFDNYIKALYASRKFSYDNYAEMKITVENENFNATLEKLYLYLNAN